MDDVVAQDLLRTKLYRPPLPVDHVTRTDLIQRLQEGRRRPLTLVCAPAGYGKSSLVSHWLEESGWPAAWISLDHDEGDVQRFLGYVTEAVRQIFPDALETCLSLTLSTELPGLAAIKNILSNELDAIEQPFLLVLDDYHQIPATSPVHEVLDALLRHPPIPLHLVVLSRRDPPLSLDRLRALGQVTEVRMQDLRLNTAEVGDFLGHAARTSISKVALANVERELEGWAAGLRLLTLAIRNVSDADEFLRGFSGGTNQMQEYLISEVLNGLSDTHRAWLLRCALLERFCAPLCDAVCEDAGASNGERLHGRAFIQFLQAGNLFLIPLDAYGHWFRFHHLFQELLRLELARQLDRRSIAELHRKAGCWLEANDFVEEALNHAIAGNDLDGAVAIFERHRRKELESDNWHTVKRWLAVLEQASVVRPSVLVTDAEIAWRFDDSRLDEALQRAYSAINDDTTDQALVGELQMMEGIRSYWKGNTESLANLLAEARRRLPDGGVFAGNTIYYEALNLALAGRSRDALKRLEQNMPPAPDSKPHYAVRLIIGLAYVSYLTGDLLTASQHASRLSPILQNSRSSYLTAWGDWLMAFLAFQFADFKQAEQLYSQASNKRFVLNKIQACDAMAGLALTHQFLGDTGAATHQVAELRSFAHEIGDAHTTMIARSCEARIQLLAGNVDAAAAWATLEQPAAPSLMQLFNKQEVSSLTWSRIQIGVGGQDRLQQAQLALQEISQRARHWHFWNQVIEAEILMSLALAGLGRKNEALKCLQSVLTLAAPGGWIKPFLEPGEELANLLGTLVADGRASDYTRQILKVIEAERGRPQAAPRTSRATTIKREDGLQENLTPREKDILILLSKRLQNKEIALELSVSPETVKSHLKHLYQKLGVSNRRQAATLADQFQCVSPA